MRGASEAPDADQHPLEERRVGRAAQAPHLVERLGEALGAHGLHQVVHRLHLEGRHGVLVVRGGEDDGGQVGVRPREREPVEPGHVDVEENHVGAVAPDALEGLEAVRGVAGHVGARQLGQHAQQPAARRRLIVHHQDLHVASSPRPARRAGSSIRIR
jgi:hypothetical protein